MQPWLGAVRTFEHVILEALKRLLPHFLQHYLHVSALNASKRQRKIEKGHFILIQNRVGGGGGCGPCLLLLVPSLGKVNTAIMSISLNLHHLYLQISHRK